MTAVEHINANNMIYFLALILHEGKKNTSCEHKDIFAKLGEIFLNVDVSFKNFKCDITKMK